MEGDGGVIEFQNVTFVYPDSADGSLKNINLTIPDGQCVLLCGRSGCGKTTLTRLINGLIPQLFAGELSGNVLLDGENIFDLPMYRIAEKVGSVFQNPRTQFFNVDTDSEIAFGTENEAIPQERLKRRTTETAKMLHIENLLGRNIFALSGGEKQRISIARAMMKDAPIIILDEATANVDPENEKELMEAISELTREKTVIMIAHRLKTVHHADQIIVVDKGQIAQRGTHEKLLRQDGIYRRFITGREQAAGWKL